VPCPRHLEQKPDPPLAFVDQRFEQADAWEVAMVRAQLVRFPQCRDQLPLSSRSSDSMSCALTNSASLSRMR
jgi:hypothetical protein